MLLSLLICFVFGLNAQENWQPGYVIQNGQKVEGEIDDREWPYAIDEFRFRRAIDRAEVTYTPTGVEGFGLDGRKYQSADVSYISNSRELDKISRDTVLDRMTARVFLRQYYGGPVNFYQYIDANDKQHFYLQREGGPLEYLEYELRLRANSQKKVVRYIENYKFQLGKLLGDCPDMLEQITETKYSLKQLMKAVGNWYKCQGGEPAYVSKINRGTIEVGGLLSLVRTTAIAQDLERGDITNEAHLGPAFGVGLRYVFPLARQKYSIKFEGGYHSFSEVIRFQARPANSGQSIRRTYSANVAQFNLLGEFLLVTGRTSVYIEGGVASNLLLDSDQSQQQLIINPDGTEVITINENLNVDVNMKNEIGWIGGLGTRRGPFQAGARVSRVARVKGNSGIGFLRVGLVAGYWF